MSIAAIARPNHPNLLAAVFKTFFIPDIIAVQFPSFIAPTTAAIPPTIPTASLTTAQKTVGNFRRADSTSRATVGLDYV